MSTTKSGIFFVSLSHSDRNAEVYRNYCYNYITKLIDIIGKILKNKRLTTFSELPFLKA